MEISHADVRRAVAFLYKGKGCTEDRLASQEALVAVLGGPSEVPLILLERFVSAIESLGGEDAPLLGDVFRLTERTFKLERVGDRRDLHGSLQTPPIRRDAVADRAEPAIDRLVSVLISGRYPKSPIPTRIAESHSGLAIYAMSFHTVVRERRHEETRYRFQFIALADGNKYIGIDTENPNTPQVISDDFSLQMKFYERGYELRFYPEEPMKRGQPYDLQYVVRNPEPRQLEPLTAEHMAFHEPTRFASFTVSFIGEVPRTIWKVDRLTSIAAPGELAPDSVLQLDKRNTAHADFHDLYGGLHSGIAWSW